MSDLQRDAGVTFLLISHDLGVVAHICETTAVMFRGRIVEMGPTDALFAAPAHPYTRELVDATPRLDRPARVPPATERRSGAETGGCAYAARCAFVRPRCLEEAPPLMTWRAGPERRVLVSAELARAGMIGLFIGIGLIFYWLGLDRSRALLARDVRFAPRPGDVIRASFSALGEARAPGADPI